jgi:hypothetical protein
MADNSNPIEANRLFNLESTRYAQASRALFRPNGKVPPPPPGWPNVRPAMRPRGPEPRAWRAFRQVNGQLIPDSISEWPGHEFVKYATPWELKRSVLIQQGPIVLGRFEPVVIEAFPGFALVVAHRGQISSRKCIAPSGLPISNYHPSRVMEYGAPMFVLEDDRETAPAGWDLCGWTDLSIEVLTTVDGQVLGILAGNTRGVVAMDITPLDLILVGRLVVGLGVAATARAIQVLVRKDAGQTVRTTLAGPTPQLAATATAKAAPAGQTIGGLKVGVGYDARMGIPEEHFPMMVAAARETEVIAVFRANKAKAIPLIRQGAHGKPRWAKFQSDKDTGVLTAKAWPEHAAAHANGFYTVAEDGKTMIMMVNGVRKELPLPKNPFWPVKPGQVIHPDGKPVVGDYDLLGVFPLKSPGRNIQGVPKNPATGDWTGPDVDKYAEVLNEKLRAKRVLHGAQDGFHNQKFGGFTDDVAYAVFPDGKSVVMAGRAEQKAFYDAFGRQTAIGSYPRPAPGTVVPNDLAAARARKNK